MKVVNDLWILEETQTKNRPGQRISDHIHNELSRRNAEGWRLVSAYVTSDDAVWRKHWYLFERIVEGE